MRLKQESDRIGMERNGVGRESFERHMAIDLAVRDRRAARAHVAVTALLRRSRTALRPMIPVPANAFGERRHHLSLITHVSSNIIILKDPSLTFG